MDNFYKIYLNDCFNLIKSLVVKSDINAELMNEQISLIFGPGYVDYQRPETWRYNLHVCGDYHPLDTLMVITSLDTQQEITFDKKTLTSHPVTLTGYEIGSVYYKELCNKYPGQELLIKGILRPASMDTVLNAQNNTIISYNEDLVEAQEEGLIENLNNYIKNFKVRWDVKAFYHSDELYPCANDAILYMKLVPVLLNLRLNNCRTNKVHSYHIREYLRSHSGLDRFIKYLTLKQSLFLYRNINYLTTNSGTKENFLWLIERLLTERYIPIHEYSLRHTGFIGKENDYLFRKKAVNAIYNTPEKTLFNLEEILTKEVNLESNNLNWITENIDSLTTRLRYAPSSVLQTKMLESAWLDYTDFTLYTKDFVNINHWFYYTLTGVNRTYVTINIPGNDGFLLDAKTALDYYIYLSAKGLGLPYTTSNISLTRVITNTIKPYEYFSKGINTDIVDLEDIYAYLQKTHINIRSFININQLSQQLDKLYIKMKEETTVISNYAHMDANAMVNVLISRCYEDVVLEYDTQAAMRNIINNRLPLEFNDPEKYNLVLIEIYEKCTGHKIVSLDSVAKTHKNLLDILRTLSSYTVQFLGYTNKQPIKPANWLRITPGNITNVSRDTYHLPLTNIRAEGIKNKTLSSVNRANMVFVNKTHASTSSYAFINTGLSGAFNAKTPNTIHVKNTQLLNSVEDLNSYDYGSVNLESLKDIYSKGVI